LGFLTSPTSIDVTSVVIRMFVAGLIGIGIGFTYHQTFRGMTYSTSFRNTNVLITIIICAIILSIGSNVALSLGLVGSLSVIRFRAVVKDVMDMVYLFWSIGVGIACWAGQFHIAVALFAFVLAFMLVLIYSPFKLVVRDKFMMKIVYDDAADAGRLEERIRARFPEVSLRSSFRNARNETTEATYLVRLPRDETPALDELITGDLEGVRSTQVIKYDGMNVL
jgi:uncharacterized membrane protein YhiD involved in acid resistance